MKAIDLSDVLIGLGFVIALAGLYFVLWPLPVVALGAAIAYIGARRA